MNTQGFLESGALDKNSNAKYCHKMKNTAGPTGFLLLFEAIIVLYEQNGRKITYAVTLRQKELALPANKMQ